MKRFTHRNEEFICEVCGVKNPPVKETCRNHCRKCLHSKHVDVNPGDRKEQCGGIMEPLFIEVGGSEMKAIIFKCQKCGIKRKNRIAPDDDREKLLETIEKNRNLC
ncbi:RNHCP domain-containing protein [Candidatus Gracilibacteria bacterium]|nr:RNHCP domain-containing protein [Candidatus Gracilibacteria bacterium]